MKGPLIGEPIVQLGPAFQNEPSWAMILQISVRGQTEKIGFDDKTLNSQWLSES
jgi:hypothetical protein